MKTNNSQPGFTIIEIIIAIATLAIGVAIGIFGMLYFNGSKVSAPASNTNTKNTTNQSDSVANDVPTAPIINSVQSLDTATSMMDNINLDSDLSGDTHNLDAKTVDF